MNLLFVGDLYGTAGLRVLRRRLPALIDRHAADFTVVNVENAAGGFGITPEIAREVLDLGADCLTTGNHAFDRREALDCFDAEPRLLRPLNYPPGCPGAGLLVAETPAGIPVAVVQVMGRVHMAASPDCPFRALDGALARLEGRARVVIVDAHAEATSEKAAIAAHADGRVSAVIGTHTHVPTADERILPGGTAYITDVGMTGPHDGVIGAERVSALRRFVTQVPGRLPEASGDARVNAALVRIDETSGRAVSIERVVARAEGA